MPDMHGDSRPYSTTEFTDAIINNLGRRSHGGVARLSSALNVPPARHDVGSVTVSSRHVMGADVFIETTEHPEAIVETITRVTAGSPLRFLSLANRGTTVFPRDVVLSDGATIGLVDHYRCRFVVRERGDVTDTALLDLLRRIGERYSWMHVEKLQQFDGVDAFSKAQG